jgi:hypothetical protein
MTTKQKPKLTIEEVAKLARNINRMYSASINDEVPEIWERSTEAEKESMIRGVKFHIANDFTPEESHMIWVKQKINDGWCYDMNFDATLKLSPHLIPYNQLPIEQRVKDHIFRGLVIGLKPFIEV